jgi:hypothetical protein
LSQLLAEFPWNIRLGLDTDDEGRFLDGIQFLKRLAFNLQKVAPIEPPKWHGTSPFMRIALHDAYNSGRHCGGASIACYATGIFNLDVFTSRAIGGIKGFERFTYAFTTD